VPTQSLMITLAVTAAQAEAVVFGMEHGTIWLTLEPADADTGGTSVVDPGNIYEKDFS
jgi:pilus assembly protein CpaB